LKLNFITIIRAIESTHDSSHSEKITMVIDIDTMSNYRLLLDQVKDLGMTKSKFNYILATIVILLLNIYLDYDL
jgi:hypothetical protein